MHDQYDIRRGYVYNFPKMCTGFNVPDQLCKIYEEYEEACAAYNTLLETDGDDSEEVMEFVIEVMDIVHACETLIRMMGEYCNIDKARRQTILKNWEREYYVEDATE